MACLTTLASSWVALAPTTLTPSNTSTRTASSSNVSYDRPTGRKKETAAKKGGMAGKDRDDFPNPEEYIMIFSGSDAIWSKRQHKVCYREACATKTVVPSFLN